MTWKGLVETVRRLASSPLVQIPFRPEDREILRKIERPANLRVHISEPSELARSDEHAGRTITGEGSESRRHDAERLPHEQLDAYFQRPLHVKEITRLGRGAPVGPRRRSPDQSRRTRGLV